MENIIKDNNTGIVYRKWEEENPKAVFILVHGLGAHSGRWEFFANYTMQHGFSNYGIDLKGFGYTGQKKGHIDSLEVYEKDICDFRDLILEANPGKKIFLLGESMGGLISFITALKNKSKFDGLICMSPAFQSKLKFSLAEYLKIGVAVLFDAGKEFRMPFTKEMCTRDIGYQAVLDTDDAEHRIGTAGLLLEIGKGQVYSLLHKKDFDSDVLFLLSGKDKLVDSATSKKVFAGISSSNKKLIEYPEMYHALSIEIGRNEVFKDVVEWVDKIIDQEN